MQCYDEYDGIIYVDAHYTSSLKCNQTGQADIGGRVKNLDPRK